MTQKHPTQKKAIHGIGEYWFFNNYYEMASMEDNQWSKVYQNKMSNFIRTGNPNDWSNSPNRGLCCCLFFLQMKFLSKVEFRSKIAILGGLFVHIFSNNEFHIILKCMNLEICEHSRFSNY